MVRTIDTRHAFGSLLRYGPLLLVPPAIGGSSPGRKFRPFELATTPRTIRTPMTFQKMSLPRAILFDLEGTLHVGEVPVSGAPRAIERLRDAGVPIRFLTNTTRYSRHDLASRLVAMGFPIEEEQLFTTSRAAASWLGRRGIRRVMLCVPDSTRADFSGFEEDLGSPGAVVVGDMGNGWSFGLLNEAFRALMDGAILLALQKNRYFMSSDGLTLDAGPFVAALEHAAHVDAIVIGKPSRNFFALAAAALDAKPADITVVGDDIEADVGGAQAAGMRGVLVKTGKFRDDTLEESSVIPNGMAESVTHLVDSWLGSDPGDLPHS